MRVLFRRVLLLVLALFLGFITYSSDWFQKKYVFPFPNQELIYHYAVKNNLDPFLVAAIIRTESKFLPRARSPRGAMGLMQIMPETAQWVAQEAKESDFTLDRLADPEVSIRMGTWYLANLSREFKANPVLVLAAYNGGRGNVKEWMQRFGWSYQLVDAGQIPFKDTREYVAKVLYSQKRYSELYGK